MVDRATGKARSFKIDAVDGQTVIPIVRKNIAKESVIITDDAAHYKHLAKGFASHEVVPAPMTMKSWAVTQDSSEKETYSDTL